MDRCRLPARGRRPQTTVATRQLRGWGRWPGRRPTNRSSRGPNRTTRGTPAGREPPLPNGDLDATWADAKATFIGGLDSEGALDRILDLPFGSVPGAVVLALLKFDVLVHCHDLARATDQPFDPPAHIVAECREIAKTSADGLRAAGAMNPAVDPRAGATPIEQLSAFCGPVI